MINSKTKSKATNNKADKTNLWPNSIRGLPEIISDNFPKATRLPENVIPPIKTVNEIAIICIRVVLDGLMNSATPTKRLAIPPNPLNLRLWGFDRALLWCSFRQWWSIFPSGNPNPRRGKCSIPCSPIDAPKSFLR